MRCIPASRPKNWQSAMCESQVSGCQLPACQRERPFDAGPRQAVLHHGVFGDVIVVVIKREAVVRRRQINRQRAQHEQQCDETGSRHRLLVWDYCPETKRVFQKKSRCEISAERVSIGTAENDSTVRRLAANSVPHDQVNCRYDERIIVYCRGGRFQSSGHPLRFGKGDAGSQGDHRLSSLFFPSSCGR